MASSVATPLEKQFSTIAGIDAMTSSSAPGHRRSITLQFALDRDIDAAAQDVQAAISAAARQLPPNMPAPPSYPQGEPGRLAGALPRADLDDAAAVDVNEYAETLSRSASRRSTAWRRCRCSAAEVRGARAARSRRARRARHRHRRGRAGGRPTPTSTCRPARSTASDQRVHRAVDRPAHERRRPSGRSIVAYRNGAPVRLQEIGRVIDSVENDKVAAWFNGKRAHRARHPAPAGHQHRRGGRRDQEAAARRSAQQSRRRSISRCSTTARSRSASRSTTCSSPCCSRSCWWCW